MQVERTVLLNELFDAYGQLLTPRQSELFRRYYHEDLSLAEIAEEFAITRQGVYDILRRSVRSLEDFEAKLGLVARHRRQHRLLAEMEAEWKRLQAVAGSTDLYALVNQHGDESAVRAFGRWVNTWRQELEAGASEPGTGV